MDNKIPGIGFVIRTLPIPGLVSVVCFTVFRLPAYGICILIAQTEKQHKKESEIISFYGTVRADCSSNTDIPFPVAVTGFGHCPPGIA